MKKIALSLAASLVSTVVVSAAAYAINQNGGVKRTAAKLWRHPIVAGAMSKVDVLKQRFANDDSPDAQAA
jgi:hypothetical protein